MNIIKLFNFFLILVLIILTYNLLKVENYNGLNENTIATVQTGVLNKIKTNYVGTPPTNFSVPVLPSYNELDKKFDDYSYKSHILESVFNSNLGKNDITDITDIDKKFLNTDYEIDMSDGVDKYRIINKLYPFIKFKFEPDNNCTSPTMLNCDKISLESGTIKLIINNKYITYNTSTKILGMDTNKSNGYNFTYYRNNVLPIDINSTNGLTNNNEQFYLIEIIRDKYLYIHNDDINYRLDIVNTVNLMDDHKFYFIKNKQ